MRRLFAIALNTFKEAVRDRVLYSILFFAVGMMVISLALQDITIGDQAKIVRSVAQGAIDFFGSLIAMFLGVSLVWKEIERRTAYTILSKPIPRWMFILGKYLGLMLTLVVEVAIMLAVYCVLMTVQQKFPPPVVFVSIGMLLLELMLLTAWATLFSTYSAPTTASFFTLAIFAIGHLADDIWLYGNKAQSEVIRELSHQLYWILPNLEVFNLRPVAVHELPIPWTQVWSGALYGLGYTAAVLCLAMAVFHNRDLK